jgi:hypothetical protein
MTSESQQAPQHDSEHDQPEHDEPNEAGFAGAGTSPTPEPGHKEGFGEAIAVPAGDLTGALMSAIEEAGERGHDEDDDQHR